MERSYYTTELIKQLRIKRGLSRDDLAHRLGYKTAQYIWSVESSRTLPSPKLLKEFSKALGVKLNVLKSAAMKDFEKKFR